MILCCGEALIDMIPEPTQAGGQGFVPHSGGAIFNTAIGLGRLGVAVGMVSGVSEDLFGQQLTKSLTDSHVSTDTLIRSTRPTTLAFVQLSDGHASYTFYDENSAGRGVGVADLPDVADDVQALYFGGISLCAQPAADAYCALALREAPKRLVMIDPNIRPGFIDDEDAFRARLAEMMAVADIVKLSDEDLDWLMPGAQSLAEKAQALLADGTAHVIVTRGADGADGYMAGGQVAHADVTPVQVVDTVGAGDTFNAGVLAHLSELGLLDKAALRAASVAEIQAALAFGARVAGVTVSRAGANPPWRAELGA